MSEFPADVEAQKKLKACDREIDRKLSFEELMRMGFSAAIKVEKRFELNRKCVEEMNVDVSYDGPVVSLNERISVEWIRDTLIPHFKADKRLHIKYAYSILLLAKEAFEKEPTLVDIDIQNDEIMTICGDVHGQFFDMLEIFEKNGYPSLAHKYVSITVLSDSISITYFIYLLYFYLYFLCIFSCLMVMSWIEEAIPWNVYWHFAHSKPPPLIPSLYPAVITNRSRLTVSTAFYDECTRKYRNHQFFTIANQVLNTLPLAYVVDGRLFVVHGGLPAKEDFMLEDVRGIDRFRVPENGTWWASCCGPTRRKWTGSIRVTVRGNPLRSGCNWFILKRNKLEMIIRSHVWQAEGYAIEQSASVWQSSRHRITREQLVTERGLMSAEEVKKLEFVKFEAAEYQGKYEKPRPSAPIRGGWY